jgi:hypothetical protein
VWLFHPEAELNSAAVLRFECGSTTTTQNRHVTFPRATKAFEIISERAATLADVVDRVFFDAQDVAALPHG